MLSPIEAHVDDLIYSKAIEEDLVKKRLRIARPPVQGPLVGFTEVAARLREREVCQADTPKTVSVICLTALVTGIPITAIRGARRQAPVVRAREIAAYEIREWCRKSLPEIGRMIAGHERYKIFDHSTVLHAITSIQEKLSCGDAEIVKAIATIDSVLELFWKPGSGHPLSWVVSASYQAPCSHETVL